MSLDLEYLAADLFGLPPLSRSLLSGKAPAFGLQVPRRASDIAQPPDRFDRDERAALTTRISNSLARYSPHVAVLDSIRALEQPFTTVALATARVGLFGSTLDALYSALHAIKLSQADTDRHDRNVVPLLWIDTDDDPSQTTFEAHFKSSDYLPQRVELPAEYDEPKTDATRACLRQLLGQDAQIEAALTMLTPRVGEDIAATMTRGLLEILGPCGLLICTPRDLRADVSHFLSQVITHDPAGDIRQSLDQLKSNGYLESGHTFDSVLVKHSAVGETNALRSGGDGFCYDDEPGSRTAAELAAEIVQAPDAFVPGATLLPLIQDLVLPVAVRVVDRGALFSEAALDTLRTSIDAPRPPLAPRLSCTLVDSATRESLAKLALTTREVCSAPEAYAAPAPAAELRGAIEAFRALSKDSTDALHRIARPLWEFDPVLRPVARRSARDLRRALEMLCEKAENVLNTRGGQFDRHQRRIGSVLVPHASPQENVEYLLTWIAPDGPDWIHELLTELDPFAWEHVVVNFP